jgi:hypothetical protein
MTSGNVYGTLSRSMRSPSDLGFCMWLGGSLFVSFLIFLKSMRKNPEALRRCGLLAASSPGVIGAVVVAGRPLVYVLSGLMTAALLLIGYVITAPARRDQPFRRLHALLCLILDRESPPGCPHLTDRLISTPGSQPGLPVPADQQADHAGTQSSDPQDSQPAR